MGKKRQLHKASPEASKLIGKWLGVPTSFFGVEVEGARYLARCTEPHAKPEFIWMRFDVDNKDVYAPVNIVAGWTITDSEADDAALWYQGRGRHRCGPLNSQNSKEKSIFEIDTLHIHLQIPNIQQ